MKIITKSRMRRRQLYLLYDIGLSYIMDMAKMETEENNVLFFNLHL